MVTTGERMEPATKKIIVIFVVYFVTVGTIFFFLHNYMYAPNVNQGPVKIGQSTWNYRTLGATYGNFTVTILWMDRPLENVSATLYDADLKALQPTQITNSTGIITFIIDKDGEYYIKLEYWAYFKQGGIEIFKSWIMFIGQKGGDTVLMNLNLYPGQWPDKPEVG